MAEADPIRRHPNFKDLSGRTFGKWTILREVSHANGKVRWLCRCKCGKECAVRSNHLLSGASDGCVSCSHRAHGMSKKPEYNSWCLMRQRCANPKHRSRHRYGGRGIQVCARWASFEAFYEDMGPKPSQHHSIERKDNDGDYEPENCIWATRKQQQRNKSGNRMLTFNGETRCVSEWAELVGIHHNTLRSRLRLGWNVERVLTTPLRR
jgi:hypothetical protein